jgi:hypothetical protein
LLPFGVVVVVLVSIFSVVFVALDVFSASFVVGKESVVEIVEIVGSVLLI